MSHLILFLRLGFACYLTYKSKFIVENEFHLFDKSGSLKGTYLLYNRGIFFHESQKNIVHSSPCESTCTSYVELGYNLNLFQKWIPSPFGSLFF